MNMNIEKIKKKTDPPFNPSSYRKFSSEFVGKLLKEKLGTGECAGKGYVLDNFPKTYDDCVNVFTTKEGEEILIDKELLPDGIIMFKDYSEESLKQKLAKQNPDYAEKQIEYDARFNRRLAQYKNDNEQAIPQPPPSKVDKNAEVPPPQIPRYLKEFYMENKIDIHFINETNYEINPQQEIGLIYEYLEKDGPINNYEKLHDEEEIIPFREPEEANNQEEEKILMENNEFLNSQTNKEQNNNLKNDIINENEENEESILNKERKVEDDSVVKEEKKEETEEKKVKKIKY